MITQSVSVAGAAVVLYAFFQQQRGRWTAQQKRYLACNFVGTLVLTVVAWMESQWGFVLIEAIWAMVSLRSLLRVLRAS